MFASICIRMHTPQNWGHWRSLSLWRRPPTTHSSCVQIKSRCIKITTPLTSHVPSSHRVKTVTVGHVHLWYLGHVHLWCLSLCFGNDNHCLYNNFSQIILKSRNLICCLVSTWPSLSHTCCCMLELLDTSYLTRGIGHEYWTVTWHLTGWGVSVRVRATWRWQRWTHHPAGP